MTIDYAHARELMVEQQIRPWDVLDIKVLDVLARLPREAFVADAHRALAYADVELPIGHGQKMMKPVIEGRTLQALDLQPGDEVLEIGTGSGFLAACIGALARDVLSLEIDRNWPPPRVPAWMLPASAPTSAWKWLTPCPGRPNAALT